MAEVVDLVSDGEDDGSEAKKSNKNSSRLSPPTSKYNDGGRVSISSSDVIDIDIDGGDGGVTKVAKNQSSKKRIDDGLENHTLQMKEPRKNPYKKDTASNKSGDGKSKTKHATSAASDIHQKKRKTKQMQYPPSDRELQAGLVFEEDVDHNIRHNRPSKVDECSFDDEESENDDILTNPLSVREYAQHQLTSRLAHNLPPLLYHDPDFVAGRPDTVDGTSKGGTSIAPPKCICRPPRPCALAYTSKAGPNCDRPYYCCQKGKGKGCNYFSWAFTSHMLHWYRFGTHNSHVLVNPDRGFSAEDLVQGKVGDCWFLSALAVVAERDDLIGRLIGSNLLKGDGNKDKKFRTQLTTSNNFGMIEVKLFVDGFWKTIIMDDFLPCLIDHDAEDTIQVALRQSLVDAGMDQPWLTQVLASNGNDKPRISSKFDPNSMADECHVTLHEIHEFIHQDRFGKDPSYRSRPPSTLGNRHSFSLQRPIFTSDLAYSKAQHNQLWVPFIEKAYAKIHGSYRAISGGHVEEAFLDLTGAPTAVYNFDHHDFNPRRFWSELMHYRLKKLPMGCGTSQTQEGIVGMHAYSILDVREVKNVGLDFFNDKIAQGTLGNVSGFTELDGTVRLLRIRNPHGKGEWKGEFSDRSPIWERLMANKNVIWKESKLVVDLTAPQSPELKRTMKDDGTFWIDYDSFLQAFHNVDVVLAFQGNHAKSFASSFPTKTSNHRCSRAFELSAIGQQPGEEGAINNTVEVYVMIIQKTKRGASLGRADRKVSYKTSDVGILVGERLNANDGKVELGDVDGKFFGMTRNGHIRIVLDRNQPDRKLVVMPISFGHPSATDDERSFVVRVVSDSPLLVQELPKPPQMNIAVQKFCFGQKIMSLSNAGTSRHRGIQGTKTVLMECRVNTSYLFKVLQIDCLAGGGGTILLYLVVNDIYLAQGSEAISFSIEINCRGMVCRSANGLENHEVISKGKKFEAAWRRFSLTFVGETKSRMLAAIVQGGQDHQMGSIKCSSGTIGKGNVSGLMTEYMKTSPSTVGKDSFAKYEDFGVYTSTDTPSERNGAEYVDLLSSIQFPATNGKQQHTPPINVDSIDENDENLDAAIMASIIERSKGKGGDDIIDLESQCSFDEDVRQAIELSLKDQ